MDKGRSKHRTKKCRQLYYQLKITRQAFDELVPNPKDSGELKESKRVFVVEKGKIINLVIDNIDPLFVFSKDVITVDIDKDDENFLKKF
ncbi:hypothetical protein HON36_03195 [Candidatus Parcubacteria bacterium]|jgi:hypothetical protein|nr:hypothetical protein [Candidatus Parcubacteria bacterium]MBT7228769.1 hypothetical protein [Candidatus Parcubacteria bacterium]